MRKSKLYRRSIDYSLTRLQLRPQYPVGDESEGFVALSGHLDNVLHVYTASISTCFHSA